MESDVGALEREWAHLQADAALGQEGGAENASSASAPRGGPSSSTATDVVRAVSSGGNDGDGSDSAPGGQWPEPTLAELDRSIPQVDCEFIANLIRSRNLRRDAFLREKTSVKHRVAELTRQTTDSVSEAVKLPLFGSLNFWHNGVAALRGAETEAVTALAPTAAESPVLASEEVLAQLTPSERDALEAARPEYDDGFILLDCRTVNEVTSWGMIEGAKVLPAHELFAAFHSTPEDFVKAYGFEKPRPGQMIICYCQFGPRSLMAAQILSWMGYLKVLHFRDGYYEWGKQYNLLLRRWMEHDRASGNELRRAASFRAGLELQREIAPEFNALPMKEAARYVIDESRSPGTLLIGSGLRAEAYARVAELTAGLPASTALPGHLEDSAQNETSRRGQHLTQFLEQSTGISPLDEPAAGTDLLNVSDAQAQAMENVHGDIPYAQSPASHGGSHKKNR